MPITGTVPITAPIAPTSEVATYPVTNPAYGLGGLRTVGTTADRNSISIARREVGMLVYVSGENKYYHLVGGTADANWQEFTVGGGTGAPAGPSGSVQFRDGDSLSGTSNLLFNSSQNRLVLGTNTVIQFGDSTTQGTARNFYGITGPTTQRFPQGLSGVGNTGDRLLIATGPSSDPFRNYVRFGNGWFQVAGVGGIVAGSDGVGVTSLNGLTGAITLSAGDNVAITVSGNTLIFSSSDTFDSDITASIAPDKSFGKYSYGDRVPAAGKTAVEVIRDSLIDTVSPLLTLSSASTVSFNQTAISNVLNMTHTIRTIGATGATGTLEFRRNNTGAWTVLASNLYNPSGSFFSGSYTHGMTDTAFNTQPFNYRYTVFDSRGASGTTAFDISPIAYANPTGTLTQSAVVNRGGILESTTEREKGNVSSNLVGSGTRTNTYVPLTTWIIEFRENNAGNWLRLTSGSAAGGNSFSIPSFSHTPSNSLSNIQYRLRISDTFRDSSSTAHTVDTEPLVTFRNLIWFGPTAAPPTTSNDIRSGGLSAFNPGIIARNPLSLYTGTTYQDFVVAFPAPSTIVSAIDTINSQQDLKPFFLTANSAIGWSGLFSVNDYAGNSTSYNVYNYHVNIPYSPETLISVTRT